MLQTGPSSACHHSGQGWHQVTPALCTLTQHPCPPGASQQLSPFMICCSSICRVCTARPGWSPAVRLTRWMDRRPSTTAATSSSSRKITRLVCSMTALWGHRGHHTLFWAASSHPTCSSRVEEFPRLLKSGRFCKLHFHPANGTGFFPPSSLLISGPTLRRSSELLRQSSMCNNGICLEL